MRPNEPREFAVIRIENTLISDDILEHFFSCPLLKCHGRCCVDGDAGAPLEKRECDLLDAHIPILSQFVSAKGSAIIRSVGTWVQSPDGLLETPLLPTWECAYAVSKNGIFTCGIELAFLDGKFPIPKPISCHLYPIRIRETPTFTILNLHRWDICETARILGKHDGIHLVQFLKSPLIRRFSNAWYAKLQEHVSAG